MGRAEQRQPCGCEPWLRAPVPLQRAMVPSWGGGLGPPAARRKPLLLCARSETRAGEPQVRCGWAVGDGERQPALAGLLAVRGGDGVHHGGGGSPGQSGGTPGCAAGAAQPGLVEWCLCAGGCPQADGELQSALHRGVLAVTADPCLCPACAHCLQVGQAGGCGPAMHRGSAPAGPRSLPHMAPCSWLPATAKGCPPTPSLSPGSSTAPGTTSTPTSLPPSGYGRPR